MPAKKIGLNKIAQDRWIHNLILFFRPVAILYLLTIVGVISQSNHPFQLKDFIPSQIAQGGLILYVLNGALDYLRKLG